MKQFKKLIACVLAATLVLGSTTVFFGAETTYTDKDSTQGTITGGGTIEGVVDREVFTVVVPTDSASSDAYDFILDPEGLITLTDGEKFATDDSVQFLTTGGSMYFQVSSTAYNTLSQEATLINKSSVDVVVTLNATVTVPTSNSAVTFVDSADFSSSTGLDVYLAIEGRDEAGNPVTGSAIATASGNTYSTKVTTELASYNAYHVAVSGDGYVYEIDSTIAGNVTPAAYTFWLTGACNTNADWSTYVQDEAAKPSIKLVWDVKVKQEAEVVEDVAPTFTTGDGLGQIKYTVGSGDLALASIESINMTNDIGTFDGYNASDFGWSAATKADGVITMDTTYMGFYNANAKTTATITYKTVGGETKTATVDVISK